MGGSFSKRGRTLPTKAKFLASGGASSDIPSHHPISRPRLVVDETKNHVTENDGKNPHLLANLERIGQVNVQSALKISGVNANQLSHMYRTKELAEQQAASTKPVRNRLVAGSLSKLLDDRKSIRSRRELERLANRYTIEHTVLDSLAKFANTPSIGERTVSRTIGDDGQEKITMQAVWIEPILKDR